MEIRHKPKPELLFEERIPEFNRLVAEGQAPDLRYSNLSGLDLHTANLRGLDLTGAYMRGTNLKGLDLTGCNLAGASLQHAMISGALFPENVTVDELRLSVEYGTRIRTFDLERRMDRITRLAEEMYLMMKRREQRESSKA